MIINEHKLYTTIHLFGVYGGHAIYTEAIKGSTPTQIIVNVIFIPVQTGNKHNILQHPKREASHENRIGLR